MIWWFPPPTKTQYLQPCHAWRVKHCCLGHQHTARKTAACYETCYVPAESHPELQQHVAGDRPELAGLGEAVPLVLAEGYTELLLLVGLADCHTEPHQPVAVCFPGHAGHGEAGIVVDLADETDMTHVAEELTAVVFAVVEKLVGVLLVPAPGNDFQCGGGSSTPSWTAEDEDGVWCSVEPFVVEAAVVEAAVVEAAVVEAAGKAPVGRAAGEELAEEATDVEHVVVREVVLELVPGKWHQCEDQFSIHS